LLCSNLIKPIDYLPSADRDLFDILFPRNFVLIPKTSFIFNVRGGMKQDG